MEIEKMNDEDFYLRCAELLGATYNCEPFPWPEYKRTRWNNRKPGSGRYPGYGIIRKFGNQIQVALTYPVQHHGIYKSESEVFSFLESVCQ